MTGGAVLAAAVLAGGGVAVGAAIADDSDDDDREVSVSSGVSSTDDVSTDDERTDAADLGDAGSSSAAELTDTIETAAASADGDPVAIEAEGDGSWDVTFRTDAGHEAEVRVAADGAARVLSTDAADADDDAPAGSLDDDTVESVITAALAETAGKVVDLEIDDDPASPYDITVLTGEGRLVGISLDADFTVVSSDRD
jgi:uncharacterized membrane protein YkoI